MKRYTTGLITGILLTASCVMFMAAKNNEVGRYARYSNNLSPQMLDVFDTQTGIMTARFLTTGEGNEIDIINGKIRYQVSGEDWGEWKVIKDQNKK